MGGAIAANLVKAGYTVRGFDPIGAAYETAQKANIETFESPAEASQNAEVICSSVPKGEHVREVYLGEKGALVSALLGVACFDFSTISPEESYAIAKEAHNRGFDFLDAPISSNAWIAREAKIGFMAGGNMEVLEKHRDILESVSELIDYFGPNGTGLKMKLITNQLVACQLSALAEGFTLGLKARLNPNHMMDHLYSSTVFRVMHTRGRGLANKEYEPPKFSLAFMYKDLGLIRKFAEAEGVTLPLTNSIYDIYKETIEMGNGEKDQAVIREWFEHVADLR